MMCFCCLGIEGFVGAGVVVVVAVVVAVAVADTVGEPVLWISNPGFRSLETVGRLSRDRTWLRLGQRLFQLLWAIRYSIAC